MFVNQINIIDVCSPIDWIIFFLLFFITILSIYYGNKLKSQKKFSNSNSSLNSSSYAKNNHNFTFKINSRKTKIFEHLLMGRQLTLPLFIATLSSSWYGDIFGVTQIAFEHGIYNFITQCLFWYIAYFIFAIFLAKKINSSRALTMPNLVSKIYGNKSAKLAAIIILAKTLPISYAISLGLFLQLIIPMNLTLAISIGILLVTIYCFFGGFRAIVFTDAIQFVVMCLGVFSVLLFSFIKFGGISYLKANLPASHFNITSNYSFAYTISWLFIAFSSTFINPTFYQRCFAASSAKVASRGILWSILVWALFDICTTLGAMYAKSAIPNAPAINGYITYALQILPMGFRGLLLATILATILSTLDAKLFLASNVLFFDLKILKIKNIHLKHLISLTFVAIATIYLASRFDGNIETTWRVFRSYFSACFLIPFLWGYLFPKYKKDYYFILTCSTSIIAVSTWDIFNLQQYFYICSFYSGNIISIVTLLTLQFYHTIRKKFKFKQLIDENLLETQG